MEFVRCTSLERRARGDVPGPPRGPAYRPPTTLDRYDRRPHTGRCMVAEADPNAHIRSIRAGRRLRRHPAHRQPAGRRRRCRAAAGTGLRAVAREFNRSETTFLLPPRAGGDPAAALIHAGRRRGHRRRAQLAGRLVVARHGRGVSRSRPMAGPSSRRRSEAASCPSRVIGRDGRPTGGRDRAGAAGTRPHRD